MLFYKSTPMRKCLSLFLFLLLITVNAKESLYVNIPQASPHQHSATTFGKELIALIDASKEEIVFAIYGLRSQEDILAALLRAKKRGVSIKGVVDSDTHGSNYYDHTGLLHEHFSLKSDHKSAIMHNKFFVFDRKIVWSGSSNISDTGTGGYNANAVIVTEDKAVANVYHQEFDQMYEGNFGKKKHEIHRENIRTDESTLSVYFSPKSNTYEKAIKPLIQNAKHSIYIPIFYLTHEELSKELIKASKKGVEVKIILDASAARNKYSMHHKLREEGIAVKVENFGGKMHAKSMIVDSRYFIAGSMNFTKAGNTLNDENTLLIDNPLLAKAYETYFFELWKSIPERYLKKDPLPEGFESLHSCEDGIDNNFNHQKDHDDPSCQKKEKSTLANLFSWFK